MPLCQFQCTVCETRFSLNIETFEDEVDACCTNCESTKIFAVVTEEMGEDCENCPAGQAKFIGGRCGSGKKC